MTDKHIEQLREGHRQRRSAINELHFTYKGLQRLLTTMVRRPGNDAIAGILRTQMAQDRTVMNDLAHVAMDHGQPPVPSTCAVADALLAEVYHADRQGAMGYSRMDGLLQGLKAVRMHLLRTWERLIEQAPADMLPRFREVARRLQVMEAEQHRVLLEYEARLLRPGSTQDRLTA
ncbi:MAG: hypothetical protein H6595_11795 [Flavobacteriales bacterium]|nr:hypothetical protein [Flavobacteriales bacterium]MCB9168143.1 hypothetical protein [Flavobacteriales bacterium]MCB9194292.1 hypothetical protein [Flavobacteriales bacterium]